MFANEEEQMKQVEELHKDPKLKDVFHRTIGVTTAWRFCVWCGEEIPRG